MINCTPSDSDQLQQNVSHVCTDVTVRDTQITITVLVSIFLVVGAAGNMITIIVIIKNKPLHTPCNFFIVSLCVSDFISALICSPLWLYRRVWGFDEWLVGEWLCQFYWFTDFATNYVTSMHILSFAILRFFAVHFPFKIACVTKRRVLIYIGILWFIAIAMSTPLFALMGVVYGRTYQKEGRYWPSCSIYNNEECVNKSTDDENPKACCIDQYYVYILVVSSIFFYVPEVLIIILSICIARALLVRRRWRQEATNIFTITENYTLNPRSPDLPIPDVIPNPHAEPNPQNETTHDVQRVTFSSTRLRTNETFVYRGLQQIQNERNVFLQLSLIVIAFMIGYIPATIYLVWTTAASNPMDPIGGCFDYWFGVVSYLCLRLSECMNPLMYNLGSGNIRRATKKLFVGRGRTSCCQ